MPCHFVARYRWPLDCSHFSSSAKGGGGTAEAVFSGAADSSLSCGGFPPLLEEGWWLWGREGKSPRALFFYKRPRLLTARQCGESAPS